MTSFDAVMLSFDEPFANTLHARLEAVLTQPVKRVHGVVGMRRAYQLAAQACDSEMFWLADGDFDIDTGFPHHLAEPLAGDVSMRVWKARNPINGLNYGYGGLKLARRSDFTALRDTVDVLAGLPGRVEFSAQTAGTTRVDQSAFHAWKAGFRECAMLAAGCEYGMSRTSATAKIDGWLSGGKGRFAGVAAAGAAAGIAFASDNRGTPSALEVINQPGWLAERYALDSGER